MDIQDRLTKYMDELEKALSKSAEFASAEAPLVVKEFLAWEFWSHAMGLIACLSVVVLLVTATYRNRKFIIKQCDPCTSDMGPLIVLPVIFGGAAFLMCSIGTCLNATHVVKVTVAPRLVLLEKVASLAHGNNK